MRIRISHMVKHLQNKVLRHKAHRVTTEIIQFLSILTIRKQGLEVHQARTNKGLKRK
jgi:hypothetical protein